MFFKTFVHYRWRQEPTEFDPCADATEDAVEFHFRFPPYKRSTFHFG